MSEHISNELLASRYKKPNCPVRSFKRRKLLQRLDDCGQKSITVLTAPAGFGKTYLLSYWASMKSMPVSWLCLGEDANSPQRFWEYFIASIKQVHPEFPDDGLTERLNDRISFANGLLNALAQLPKDSRMVIDDIHCLENTELIETFRYVCINLPGNFHFTFSGRKLRFSLAKLIAEDKAQIIDKSELAFNCEEIRMLAQFWGITLPESKAVHILGKTEGWPVGVSLILSAVSKGSAVNDALECAVRPSSDISDYFSDEFFSHLHSETNDFLLRICVFTCFTAEACDYILLETGGICVDSSLMLSELWMQNLFIEQLPNGVYRLHQLLRDVLLNRLRTRNKGLYIKLGITAAKWYEHAGNYTEALELLFDLKNFEQAGKVIERNYSIIIRDGEFYLLKRWLDKLPESILNASPKLQIAKAWSMFPSGNAADAERYLSMATKKLLGNEDDSIVSCEMAAIRALNHAILQYDSNESLKYSEEAMRSLENGHGSTIEMSSLLSTGVSHLLQSEPKKAEQAFSRILLSTKNARNVFFSFFGKYYFGILEQKKGHLSRSAQYLNEAIDLTRNETGNERSVASLAHISLARIHYEWNQLDDCLKHVQTGLDLAGEWSLPSNAVNAYHTLSLVSRLKGDMQTALNATRLSYDFADVSSFATPYITHESLLGLRKKAESPIMGSSMEWAGNYLFELNKSSSIQGEKLWHVPAAVQLAIAGRDFNDSSNLLENLLIGAKNVGFNQQVIETQILRALLFKEQGRHDKALMALANALEFAQYEGYTRIFLDEGEPMKELLLEAQEQKIVPTYTDKLLSDFTRNESTARKADKKSTCPLSAREMDVLRELALGKTPRQIAESLYISVGTTRCHLHNIYEKLGAANQVQAVRIAREQNWI